METKQPHTILYGLDLFSIHQFSIISRLTMAILFTILAVCINIVSVCLSKCLTEIEFQKNFQKAPRKNEDITCKQKEAKCVYRILSVIFCIVGILCTCCGLNTTLTATRVALNIHDSIRKSPIFNKDCTNTTNSNMPH